MKVPPADGRSTPSLALGGSNDDLTNNIVLPATATGASFSDMTQLCLTMVLLLALLKRLLYPVPLLQGMIPL